MNVTTSAPVTIAVLMTCFNRRAQTLKCLERLYAQRGQQDFYPSVFLVDDNSTDGTADAVMARFPPVEILRGSGSLYWNGGMRVAFARALTQDFDFYLWLNDDTEMFPKALEALLITHGKLAQQGVCAIVAGGTCDKVTGRASYGGQSWAAGSRRRLELAEPHPTEATPCDTMNGNCTLIPRQIAQTVGNLDAAFQHSFGDLDYGFRARAAGFEVYVAPAFVAACSDNPRGGTWRDRSLPLRQRWNHLTSAKGSPFPEWALYCRRHLGMLWPLYAVSPYLKIVASSMLGGFTP